MIERWLKLWLNLANKLWENLNNKDKLILVEK